MQTDAALRFWKHLAERERDALGFLPFGSVARVAELGRLLIQEASDEPIGFLLHGPPRPIIRVYQTAVRLDARRRDNALALVDRLLAAGVAGGSRACMLHCAADLEANAFWLAAGFTAVGVRTRSTRRQRPQLTWWRSLTGEAIDDQVAELCHSSPTRGEGLTPAKFDELQAQFGRLLALAPRSR